MARFTALSLDDVEPAPVYAGPVDVTGVEWSRRMSPDDFSLWLVVSALEEGAVLHWDAQHGDECVQVLEGELELDGRRCPPGGALIVESGVSCDVRALSRAVVAHFGSTDPAPPADGLYGAPDPYGHGVHVVGERGWFEAGGGARNRQIWWADSTCPTCRISVFQVYAKGLDLRGVPHHHTQDEIIYMVEGTMRLGALEFTPGTAVSIPAHLRYAVSGDGRPRSFLNFRRDVAMLQLADGSDAIRESGLTFDGKVVADFR